MNDLGWTKMLSKLSHLKWLHWGYVSSEKKTHPNPPMGNLILASNPRWPTLYRLKKLNEHHFLTKWHRKTFKGSFLTNLRTPIRLVIFSEQLEVKIMCYGQGHCQIWSQSSPNDTYQPGISLSAASSTIDNINLTVLNVNALYGMFQSQLYYNVLFQIFLN